MNKITSVCVYCASSTKIDSAYFEAARELGTLLGQRHIRLINGAGGIGLMRATADAVPVLVLILWWSKAGNTRGLRR